MAQLYGGNSLEETGKYVKKKPASIAVNMSFTGTEINGNINGYFWKYNFLFPNLSLQIFIPIILMRKEFEPLLALRSSEMITYKEETEISSFQLWGCVLNILLGICSILWRFVYILPLPWTINIWAMIEYLEGLGILKMLLY